MALSGSSGLLAAYVPPNMPQYDAACREFSWEAAWRECDGLPLGRGLNIAHEAVDRHAKSDRAEQVALRCLSETGSRCEVSFSALARLSSRFAAALERLGVAPGERVFVYAGRSLEQVTAAIGAFKARCIYTPLFAAFGPDPVAARVAIARPKVLVTTQSLYRRKLIRIRDQLAVIDHLIVIPNEKLPLPSGSLNWHELLAEASDHYEIGETPPESPAMLHFTSGTSGMPKGVVHSHEAVIAHQVTGRFALDLQDDDIFWCTADPGWITGTSYGIIAPLVCGVTSIIDEGEFDPQRWYRIIQNEKVTVWYTVPTAIRMMMRQGTEAAIRFDTSSLRLLASVGEPLNPEVVIWGRETFGHSFHDTYWQTETGGIMIANVRAVEIHPGSMGKPLPGIEAAVVTTGKDGHLIEVTDPEMHGEIAIRPTWPAMFTGYWNEPRHYAECFQDGWYLTGDLARRDFQGYFWFVGRADDVIKTAGHLVGPFEVESVLLEHPAVAEAGVIGKPDPEAHEIIKAFVTLRTGYEPTDELRRALIGYSRKRLGVMSAPHAVAFMARLPRTRTGKIMRRLLKARELGLPIGDISALDTIE